MALTFPLNVYSNPLKLCDFLYIRKAIFIRKFENSVILLKQREIHKFKSNIFPIAIWTKAYLLDAAFSVGSILKLLNELENMFSEKVQ
jgi:hypothetical protein